MANPKERARLRHHPALKRLGQRSGRGLRHFTDRLLDLLVPTPPPRPLPAVDTVKRVLLVRSNFRLGNALLATPLVGALQRIWPQARIDVLATDATADIFSRLPEIGKIHQLSRRFVARPLGAFRLLRELRGERYDLAIEGGMGSFSGGLASSLSGAGLRVGADGRNRRFLDVPLKAIEVRHAYDWVPELARQLGGHALDRPTFPLHPAEIADARQCLSGFGLLEPSGEPMPYAVAFVGGHLKKRWPIERWREVFAQVAADLPILVALGPEEAHLAAGIAGPGTAGRLHVLPPGTIGRLGALFASAQVVATTDSGPLHLAAGVGARIVAVVSAAASERYLPRGPGDIVLRSPKPVEVAEALCERFAATRD